SPTICHQELGLVTFVSEGKGCCLCLGAPQVDYHGGALSEALPTHPTLVAPLPRVHSAMVKLLEKLFSQRGHFSELCWKPCPQSGQRMGHSSHWCLRRSPLDLSLNLQLLLKPLPQSRQWNGISSMCMSWWLRRWELRWKVFLH
uniref:Uncharacterized protein n=1 Tax=Geospiza parvula TaxID=87175 RepID=A0A8U8C9L5_GEOPR